MPDPDDLGTYDGHTIDVGPVSCPACKRPYVSAPTLTEEERRLRDRLHQRTMDGYEDGYAEVYVVTDDLHDALAIIDRLSASTEGTCSRCGGLGAVDEHGGPRPLGTHGTHRCPRCASTEEGTDG